MSAVKKGRIFVVSAPSGCGKTTICNRILKRVKNFAPSVSATTRARRPGEKNKKDYHFISRDRFKKAIKKGDFLEWEKNYGYLYGTPKKAALKKIKEGKNLLLNIDVKGAMRLRKKFPDGVFIFLKPPSTKELLRRLRNRRTDGDREIKIRLGIAKKELQLAPEYDHVIVNDKLDKAIKKVVSIINREVKIGLRSSGRTAEK